MLRNYIKIAFRNLIKNKAFTLINIFGLAFGIACFTFISFWISDELSINRYHSNIDNIYQIMVDVDYLAESHIRPYAPSALADPISNEIPEVVNIARVFPAEVVVSTSQFKFSEKGIYADPAILTIFDFPLKEGALESILNETNSIVISSKLAEKYFPGESALGKQIEIVQKEKESYTITGVLDNIPTISSIQFDFLMSYERFENEFRPWWKGSNKWSYTNYNVTTYALLNPDASISEFDKKLNTLLQKNSEQGKEDALFSYPFSEIYLKSDFSEGRNPTGKIQYVKLFFVIAFIVLIIACINFINLYTAMAGTRAKEIALRKVAGAKKNQIVTQFLTESILVSIFASLIAITSVEVLLPIFNSLTQKAIEIPFNSIYFIFILLASSILIGFLAGVYPALFLSSFEPSKSLKNNNTSTGGITGIRKFLVITQFTLSIIFIVFTIVVFDQIEYIQSKDLGIRNKNVLFHPLHGIRGKTERYRDELKSVPGVQSVTFTEQDPYGTSNGNKGVRWQGTPENASLFFNVIQVDNDFLKTFEIKLIHGSPFRETASAKKEKEFIINEAALKAMMIKDPIGAEITVWGNEGKIVGVVSDYHHKTLAQKIEPVVIVYNPEATGNAYISFETDNHQQIISDIQNVYAKYEQDYVFDYELVDDKQASIYQEVATLGKLSSLFTISAVFISCLGLFGLSVFVMQRKAKETGIRKVLGANVFQLVILFSTGFIKLILIALAVAIPLAWYYSNTWLSDYAYHMELGLLPFLMAGISAVAIALLTIIYNTVRAAVRNPVNILKED